MSSIRRPAAALFTLCALVATGGCDSPTRPAPIARPPYVTPEVPQGPSDLTGSYTLTIEIPDACDALPVRERLRQYVATVAKTPYSYFTVHIVGGGYAEPTVVGDIRYVVANPAILDWNNFDIGGCDGWLESLPGGDTLMICGNGLAVVDDTSIVANMSASATIESGGRRATCSHPFLFTFVRQ